MSAGGRNPSDSILRNLGTIKVQLRRVRLGQARPERPDDIPLKRLHRGPYDETKVKLALAHQAELENKREVTPSTETWDVVFHPQEHERPFHSFLFRYNSEEVWRASGVIQDRQRGQREFELPESA